LRSNVRDGSILSRIEYRIGNTIFLSKILGRRFLHPTGIKLTDLLSSSGLRAVTAYLIVEKGEKMVLRKGDIVEVFRNGKSEGKARLTIFVEYHEDGWSELWLVKFLEDEILNEYPRCEYSRIVSEVNLISR